ncbi:hypothetical protein [Actinomadura rugatobispora]|uniref:Uncharacterized protein n=1 Tax=Actinomadura rugatobispora TaxID=1994 RepID=A0ABW1AGI0_9ACTN|nr:hypothetical protein GCM10010200_019400 [Actinomadura rugatobispora]
MSPHPHPQPRPRSGVRPDPDDPWNLRPITPHTGPPSPPADRPPPHLMVVDNAGDDVAAARHLAALGHPPHGRVVVRPTPGAGDVATLGLDLLVAIGKHPRAAKNERRTGFSWELGTAWLEGTGARDVIIDRAHLLGADQLTRLAATAITIGANLWLLWSTPTNPFHDHAVARARGLFDDRTQMLDLWEFQRRLPPPARPPLAAGHTDQRTWPALPAADFTTFLAACRRRLPREQFATVQAVFYDTAEATDAWYEAVLDDPAGPHLHLTHGLTGAQVTGAVTGWLRDHTVGPAPTPHAALIRLRAVQAALLVRGILLRWQPDALGPDPARRLPGDLTPTIAARLHTIARTDAAAATALALHLNHTASRLGELTLADIAPDGAQVRGPGVGRPPARRVHRLPSIFDAARPRAEDTAWREVAGPEPILVPRHARTLLTAHLAYRRGQDATDDDPLFPHPQHRNPVTMLRETIRRTCRTLGLDPPWMHPGSCVNGLDVGQIPRTVGWLVERGLTVTALDPDLAAALTLQHLDLTDNRPRWITRTPHARALPPDAPTPGPASDIDQSP